MSICSESNSIFIESDSQWTSISIDNALTSNDIDIVQLAAIPLQENASMSLTTRILAVRTGGTAGTSGETWQYSLAARAKNVAGVFTIDFSVTPLFLDTGEPVVDVNSDSGSVIIDVTGAANKTIKWVSKSDIIIVPYES